MNRNALRTVMRDPSKFGDRVNWGDGCLKVVRGLPLGGHSKNQTRFADTQGQIYTKVNGTIRKIKHVQTGSTLGAKG